MITTKYLIALLILGIAIVLSFITNRKPEPTYAWYAIGCAALYLLAIYLLHT